MALFGGKKEKKAVKTESAPVGLEVVHGVLKDPRITEKAAVVTEKGAYVFNVYPEATKANIKRAVRALYKVSPVKVNVVNTRPKAASSRMRRMKPGQKGGGRKAYVYLKKGETIELM